MPKLSNAARVTIPTGALWTSCRRCGALFAGTPGQARCRDCGPDPVSEVRCQAAHRDDVSSCEGPGSAVLIVDRVGGQVSGCVRHGAVMLASVTGARVYPGTVDGAAIEAFERAAALRPFQFDSAAGWSR